MELTRDMLYQWKQDPVTSEIMCRLREEIDLGMSSLAGGNTLDNDVGTTAQNTHYEVGRLHGLRWLFALESDEEENR